MNSDEQSLVLFCCIVDFGKGRKLMRLSQQLGCVGSTIFLGKGTINNDLLKLLGILETRREVFITLLDEETEEAFYTQVRKKLALDRPHQGIAFSMPLKYILDRDEKRVSQSKSKDVKELNYEAIFVIVDKGSLDTVLEAAEASGSTGGTVIHGRGAGSKKKEILFNIEIEPEKEIILILSKEDNTGAIVDSIKDKLKIHKPGAGIIFVLGVSRTVGLYEN